MTRYLVDTNVVSELRKGVRANAGVQRWIGGTVADELFLSALTAGELTTGVERLRRRDEVAARALDGWLSALISTYADRILPVGLDVARAWGSLGDPDPVPVVDGLIAATAQVHGLTVVSRNARDYRGAGIPVVNPFED